MRGGNNGYKIKWSFWFNGWSIQQSKTGRNAKLAKLYEKFGKLNYAKYIGDEISEDEIKDCANAIADNKEKIELYTVEIEKAKAEFNESMANMAKKTKEAFSTDFNAKPEAEADAVEVVEAKDVEIKDSDE